MADKKPVKGVFNDSDEVTGLAEFTSDDSVGVADGGTGATDAAGARTNLDVDSSTEVTSKAVNNSITFSIALG